MTELDLPRGPLTEHLEAAHSDVLYLAQVSAAPHATANAVTMHAERMRAVAYFTAVPHYVPRPEVTYDDDGHPTKPPGWSDVLLGGDTDTGDLTVLCGWTVGGTFHTYTDTETIVAAACDALADLSEKVADHG